MVLYSAKYSDWLKQRERQRPSTSRCSAVNIQYLPSSSRALRARSTMRTICAVAAAANNAYLVISTAQSQWPIVLGRVGHGDAFCATVSSSTENSVKCVHSHCSTDELPRCTR